jgi:enoyl-CoA hydratase
MAYETLIVEIEDYTCLIRLNRPDAMNALNIKLMSELADAITAADRNDKIRCIVVTGSDKAFAAGADVRELAEKSYVDVYFDDLFGPEAEAIARTRKPVIAAVAGYCLGGGCELAMMCDFIIAADTAKFGQPEINLGIVAGMGGTQRLTRLVGKAKAMDMNLTGRFMDAVEAERAGLVSRVVPAAQLRDEVMKCAAKIAEKSAVITMTVKESVNRALETTLREGLLFERRAFHAAFATEDQK